MENTITQKKNDAYIQVRVPADLKERTAKLFEELGTNTSTVVNMMLVQADRTHSIPFRVQSDGYGLSANEVIDEVAATFVLEGMPLTEQNIEDLRDIEMGRKSTEDVRQRIIADVKRRHEK